MGPFRRAPRGNNAASFPTFLSSPLTRDNEVIIKIWDEDELLRRAQEQEGIILSLATLGPGFRAVARAKHNTSQILGYCEGFIRPAGDILHLDKMEVFRAMVTEARKDGGFRGGGTLLGTGLWLGYYCLLHGSNHGCKVAEFLAIHDEEHQHKRLVRYYNRAGFRTIRYVGDDFFDIPDRLVWGGCGTLMREDIDTLLGIWTRSLQKAGDEL